MSGVCVTQSDCATGEFCVDSMCVAPAPRLDAGSFPSADGWMDAGVESVSDGSTGMTESDAGSLVVEGEICGNGRDDDGNGETDEQCDCDVGDTQDCY